MIIKKDNKVSLTIKNAVVEDSRLIDLETGEAIDMTALLENVFGDTEVKIQATASSSEEVDPSSYSDDSDNE